MSTGTGSEEGRDGDRHENGNDQYDHHQLDQGEAFVVSESAPHPMNHDDSSL